MLIGRVSDDTIAMADHDSRLDSIKLIFYLSIDLCCVTTVSINSGLVWAADDDDDDNTRNQASE